MLQGNTNGKTATRTMLADPFYATLLSSEEKQFIARFGALPRATRALLVRMVTRAGALFRHSLPYRTSNARLGVQGALVPLDLLEMGHERALCATVLQHHSFGPQALCLLPVRCG